MERRNYKGSVSDFGCLRNILRSVKGAQLSVKWSCIQHIHTLWKQSKPPSHPTPTAVPSLPPSFSLLSLLGLHELRQRAELEDLGLVNIKKRKVWFCLMAASSSSFFPLLFFFLQKKNETKRNSAAHPTALATVINAALKRTESSWGILFEAILAFVNLINQANQSVKVVTWLFSLDSTFYKAWCYQGKKKSMRVQVFFSLVLSKKKKRNKRKNTQSD